MSKMVLSNKFQIKAIVEIEKLHPFKSITDECGFKRKKGKRKRSKEKKRERKKK
jgi:hypothetical protein